VLPAKAAGFPQGYPPHSSRTGLQRVWDLSRTSGEAFAAGARCERAASGEAERSPLAGGGDRQRELNDRAAARSAVIRTSRSYSVESKSYGRVARDALHWRYL